jgi:hypothetical protein
MRRGYPAEAALARGWEMGASAAQHDGCRSELKDAVALLERALEILDSNGVSADVGARLQDLIDQIGSADVPRRQLD